MKADVKKKVETRLNRIAGQVAGVQRMVEADRYCVDLLLQIAAVRAALDGVGKLVLAGHVETCVAEAFASAIEAVQARGKSQAGEKTLLDVLVPVQQRFAGGETDFADVRETAAQSARATIPLQATKGRAAFLGERSIGHMDPGARSSEIMLRAICDTLESGNG